MSRSRKKNPVMACCGKGKGLKASKRRAVRKFRRIIDEELHNGSHFKRLDDRWNWPNEGKHRWENPKAYRK